MSASALRSKSRLSSLSGDIWRELGDLLGMHGLQKLWWTGSNDIRSTLKRVLFRDLRGILCRESYYKSIKHVPTGTIPTQSMCLEIQAQKITFGPHPRDTQSLKLRRLPQFYLCSVMVSDHAIRSQIPLNLSIDEIAQVPWLRCWSYIETATLVRGDFDPSVGGSHAYPFNISLAASVDHSLLAKILPDALTTKSYSNESLPNATLPSRFDFNNKTFYMSFGLLNSLRVDLPAFQAQNVDLTAATNLTSFCVRLAPSRSHPAATGVVTFTFGPNIAHIGLHSLLRYDPNSFTINLVGVENLHSLELNRISYSKWIDSTKPEDLKSLESLTLQKCVIPDAWSIHWPPCLKNLLLENVVTRSVSYHNSSAQRFRTLDPLKLPPTLLTLRLIATDSPILSRVPTADDIAAWNAQPPPAAGIIELNRLFVCLFLTEITLQGLQLPCSRLQVLQVSTIGFVESLGLLPDTLTSFDAARVMARDSESLQDSCGDFTFDESMALLRAKSANYRAFDQYAKANPSLERILPNLHSAKLNKANWTYLLPFEKVHRQLIRATAKPFAASWMPAIPGGYDLIEWLSMSISNLFATQGRQLRTLDPKWEAWNRTTQWRIAFPLPSHIVSLVIHHRAYPERCILTPLEHADSTEHRAVWSEFRDPYQSLVLSFIPLIAWNWMPLDHIVHLHLCGYVWDQISTDLRKAPCLRFLQVGTLPADGNIERFLAPLLQELVITASLQNWNNEERLTLPQEPSLSPGLKRLALRGKVSDGLKTRICDYFKNLTSLATLSNLPTDDDYATTELLP